MITEKDLDEAIAECQGVRNPTANTCIKLASFLTLKRELFNPTDEVVEMKPTYSFSSRDAYTSDTDFGRLTSEKSTYDVLSIMDETMSALSVLNPPLYNSIIRKLESL